MGNIVQGDVIYKDLIFLDSTCETRDEIFKMVTRRVNKLNLVTNENDVFQKLMEREKQISTEVGYKVVIPHAKSSSILKPYIAVVQLKESIYWTSSSSEMSQLVFMIGIPEESAANTHLRLISSLSKKLLDEEFRDYLLSEKDIEKVYEKLSAIN